MFVISIDSAREVLVRISGMRK